MAGAICEVSGQLPKEWLMKYFNTENECDLAVGGAEGDPDNDLLKNREEQIFDTDPTNPDTDGDGAYDGEEIAFNYDPKGTGKLEVSQQTAEEYLKSLGPEYEKYSEENIQKQVEQLFPSDTEIQPELPEPSELTITEENNRAAFEKYYDDTIGFEMADASEIARIQNDSFKSTPEELNRQIQRFQAVITLLKETPVPSEIAIITQLRIARNRASIRIFELIRDDYIPGDKNELFWRDFFEQTVILSQVEALGIVASQEVEAYLRQRGEL